MICLSSKRRDECSRAACPVRRPVPEQSVHDLMVQVVDIDGTVLEKPADHAEAVSMLTRQVCLKAIRLFSWEEIERPVYQLKGLSINAM